VRTLRYIAAVIASLAAPATFAAEIGLSTELEAGWTSNVGQDQSVRSDLYVIHRHRLQADARTDAVALRGSIGFSQTRHKTWTADNKREIDAEATADVVLAPATQLRGVLGIDYVEDGTLLDLGAGGLAAALSPQLALLGGLELTHAIGATTMTLGVLYEAVRPDETRFDGIDIAPLRLAARTDLWTGEATIAQALSDALELKLRGQ
jgi:hypothetical protein